MLIVEDDARVATLHAKVVAAQRGFRVAATASTSEQAIAVFNRGVRVDLMLLDVGLPGADGTTLLRSLRAKGRRPEVIAVTAARERAVVQALLQLGVIDYLVKPFTIERLEDALVRFRDRMRGLASEHLEQDAIDQVRAGQTARLPLPKGLAPQTLGAVRDVLRESDRALSSIEVGAATAIARVTARRYLEYLVTVGHAESENVYDGPGRPRKTYRWVAPVASG